MKFNKEVTLQHPSGISVRLPVGWSFSPFFFGPLPHLFSGLYGYGFFMLIFSVILAGLTVFIGNIILNFVLMENLNRKVILKYLHQGYIFAGNSEEIQEAKLYVQE